MDSYQVLYSQEALNDLKAIYNYISEELLAPMAAKDQVNAMRISISSLQTFPKGHTKVSWEPWASKEIRFLPVNNYIIFYSVDDANLRVNILRIFYGGRNIEGIVTA